MSKPPAAPSLTTPRTWGILPSVSAKPLKWSELMSMLGVSRRVLAELLKAYEEVFGPLPRREGRRVITVAEASRLLKARSLVRSGQAPSYRVALGAVKGEAELVPVARLEGLEGRLAALEEALRRVEGVLEVLLGRSEALDPILALAKHLSRELEEVKEEVAQTRLVVFGSIQEVAEQDADVLERLKVPLLLRGTPRGERELEKLGKKVGEARPKEAQPKKKVPWYLDG